MGKSNKAQVKGFIKGIIFSLLIISVIFTISAAQMTKEATLHYNNIKITVDGKEVTPSDANGKYVEPFIIDGTTYLPVRAIANALGLDVAWDGSTNTAKLSTKTQESTNEKVNAMSYAEYIAAEYDTEVTVEVYVQAVQEWWNNRISVFAQDKDGGYFIYEMKCSEEDAVKLVPGTKILVKGYKSEWAGLVEISDATFTFGDKETYIAPAFDATLLLNHPNLNNLQNRFAVFYNMTVEEIEFKNGESGDDIYVTLSRNGVSYNFCVERYLTAPDSDVYKAVSKLMPGDVIDVEGFIYWYEGVYPQITSIKTR